ARGRARRAEHFDRGRTADVPGGGRYPSVLGGDRGRGNRRLDDRARAPGRRVPRILQGGRSVNGPLFRHSVRMQRVKLVVVSLALAIWGFLLPVIYARFGSQVRAVFDTGLFPEEFAEFGGGDLFSLPGSVAFGLIHPIAIILTSVFSVGYSASAVAGER